MNNFELQSAVMLCNSELNEAATDIKLRLLEVSRLAIQALQEKLAGDSSWELTMKKALDTEFQTLGDCECVAKLAERMGYDDSRVEEGAPIFDHKTGPSKARALPAAGPWPAAVHEHDATRRTVTLTLTISGSAADIDSRIAWILDNEFIDELINNAHEQHPDLYGVMCVVESRATPCQAFSLKALGAGSDSEAAAVGKRLGAMLSAMGNVNDNVASGTMVDEIRQFRMKIHDELQGAGWRIKATNNGWRVLPPRSE